MGCVRFLKRRFLSVSLRTFPVAAVIACMLTMLIGCESTDSTAWEIEEAWEPTESAFRPLDLPAPNDVRLGSGAPGPAYWQQQADYAIEAELDAEARRLTARAVITYTNNSPDPLDYLWLHLEQNLFKSDSLAARSSPPGARFTPRGDEGGYTIEFLRDSTGTDLMMDVHDTLGLVHLPKPMAPHGDTFSFEIGWSFRVPDYGIDRLGVEDVEQGVIFQLAQWFPAVAVYDDVHGWNTLPYLGTGEFYTNFGDYDIKLTVPRSHILVCSGVLQNPEAVLTAEQMSRLEEAKASRETVMLVNAEEVGELTSRPDGDGPLTWHFKADDVRTVAWASSKSYLWDACFVTDSGPVLPDGSRAGTLVQSVYPKEGIETWSQSTDYLAFSIEGYNTRWFTYPYPSAINVNGRVGGMEYPMIIFCGGRRNARGLYGVTSHEIGHNWFPMIVNTDERRHAWMDEGFNTFINIYSDIERYPDEAEDESLYANGINEDESEADNMAGAMMGEGAQPCETLPDHVRRLGFTQYWKPAFGLHLLREEILGAERFDFAFRTYIHRWAFKSPRPSDFFRTMEDAAGADLAWFWRGWFLTTDVLDQEIVDVKQSEGSDDILVMFGNLEEMVMPVEFRVFYDDGTAETRQLPVDIWSTAYEWATGWNAGGGRNVVKIILDPRRVYPDIDRENNVWEADEAVDAE